MKKFSNLQKLWEYCEFCQVCQKPLRDVQITCGPEDKFGLSTQKKLDNFLELTSLYKNYSYKYGLPPENKLVTYTINWLTNEYSLSINKEDDEAEYIKNKYFYFYIQSFCFVCNKSRSHGTDLEFDLEKKIITNIGIERESFDLYENNIRYHISNLYETESTLISTNIENKFSLTNSKFAEFPLLNFDFSDQKKVLSKIKTLILFS